MFITEVICQECKQVFFKAIMPSHLTAKHNISMDEYRKKYPDSPIMTDDYKAKLEENRLKNKKEKSTKIESDCDIDFEEIETSPKLENIKMPEIKDIDFSKIEKLKEDSIKNSPIIFFEDSKGLIPPDKLRILNYLAHIIEGVENNYFIEKKTLSGHVEYRLITDIAIPSLKIDIEFPKSFWHNYDEPKESRDYKLRNDGWKVYDINSSAPSISDLEDVISKIKKRK